MDPTGPGQSILTEPVLVVRQVWGTPGHVEYQVFDETKRRMATAGYLPEDQLTALLDAYRLRPATAAALRVVDSQGSHLFTVAFPGMRGRAVMLIRDGEGRHLGEAVKTKGYRKVRYELRHQEQVVGAIQVLDWRQRGVRVEAGNDEQVASIRTIDDGYLLHVERPIADPLRSLVIASTVALQAAIGDESRPGAPVEHGGGTTIIRVSVLPPFLDPLRRKRR
jgi:hypothetical protein